MVGAGFFPRFFFALLSLARFGINVGFAERPFFAGLVWGLITGDMTTALFLAIFYELFWLDSLPVGTCVPPNALFPMFCVLVFAETTSSTGIHALFLPVMLTLPLGLLGSFLEKKHREWQSKGYARTLQAFHATGSVEKPARVSIGISLAQSFFLHFTIFLCVAPVVLAALHYLTVCHETVLTLPDATWPLLWAFGAMGGVLALRIKRSLTIFAIGIAALGLMLLFGLRW